MIEEINRYRERAIKSFPAGVPKIAKAIDKQAFRLLLRDQGISDKKKRSLAELMKLDYSINYYSF